MSDKSKIPTFEKYTLTIQEAAEYFHIGARRIRQLAAENPDAGYFLMNGNRVMVKRKQFELFIDEATAI